MLCMGLAFMRSEKRVLIVDDNRQVRRMIRAVVEDMVDEFVECEDGSLALAPKVLTARRRGLTIVALPQATFNAPCPEALKDTARAPRLRRD